MMGLREGGIHVQEEEKKVEQLMERFGRLSLK